ncbi:uncharacterized protein A4U43_C07F21690 [Asparagus officinalis]|uniref:RCK N-terminal domain-containing protein n=1 Tax=Asparagus officinalis TaxID=4686 RepID=A0A5P1EH80_ASPOF|nr:uncharacterized protein A4U43_C07F21690 [Asparagus officinalis]
MAVTPWLAAGGQFLASRFEQHDVRNMLPVETRECEENIEFCAFRSVLFTRAQVVTVLPRSSSPLEARRRLLPRSSSIPPSKLIDSSSKLVDSSLEARPSKLATDDLQDHIIICGFGRVGQIIAQLLSERLIPFVALDVRSDRVAAGRAFDLPVYFGDAGSQEVLHKVGSERACAAAITLDTPDHGINLEKAGATAVVPDTLEPSLQLAAAVLAQAKLQCQRLQQQSMNSDLVISQSLRRYTLNYHVHFSIQPASTSGGPLGYGYSRVTSKSETPISGEEDDVVEGALAI